MKIKRGGRNVTKIKKREEICENITHMKLQRIFFYLPDFLYVSL
jgi:hypothetical protein